MTKLREILEQVSRPEYVDLIKEYSLLGVRLEGAGAFHRETKLGSQISANTLFQVKEGDFIYSRLFAWRGALDIINGSLDSFYVSNEFPTFLPKKDKIDIEFLRLWFRLPATIAKVEALCSGSTPLTRNRLKEDNFLNLDIPLPPLEEQHRIVARIEELTAKIEEARGIKINQQKEIDILLEAILKQVRVNQIQSSIPRKKLGDITIIASGSTPSRAVLDYWNGDIPWIKTGELLDSDIYETEEYISEEGLANSSAKLFPPNTILIALYGQGQTRGRTGRLIIEASTNQACCAILPNPLVLNERFTQYWLRSLYTEMRTTAHGGAQPNWNSQTVKNIEIALPSLEEQKYLVSHFDSMQTQINALKQKQAALTTELDALLSSILNKAFKGEL